MIDNQDQVERLVRNLTEVLPLSARATPALMADLRERLSAAKITWNCKVIDVFYTGDEGGVTCHVIFDEEEKQQVFLESTTYLVFDRRLPIGVARRARPGERPHARLLHRTWTVAWPYAPLRLIVANVTRFPQTEILV